MNRALSFFWRIVKESYYAYLYRASNWTILKRFRIKGLIFLLTYRDANPITFFLFWLLICDAIIAFALDISLKTELEYYLATVAGYLSCLYMERKR